jgi:hypothetical protein
VKVKHRGMSNRAEENHGSPSGQGSWPLGRIPNSGPSTHEAGILTTITGH